MSNHEKDSAEGDIARLLEAAGPREALPDELKNRWEDHFRNELASARRRQRASRVAIALVASIACVLLILNPFATDPTAAGSIMIQAVVGQGEVLEGNTPATAAVAGRKLSPESVLQSAANSRIALTWAGYDIRLNDHTRLAIGADEVRLEAGEIFINNLDRKTVLAQATVVTAFGTVRDVGTQFKVRVAQDGMSASVRRGSILVNSGKSEHRADADAGGSKTLFLSSDHSVNVSEDSSDWSWIYPVASRFELENSTVLDFLRWSTAESGLVLRFAEDGVELAAGNTRLSGKLDADSPDPDRAVDLVLSTTRFVARREKGALLVARRSE